MNELCNKSIYTLATEGQCNFIQDKEISQTLDTWQTLIEESAKRYLTL